MGFVFLFVCCCFFVGGGGGAGGGVIHHQHVTTIRNSGEGESWSWYVINLRFNTCCNTCAEYATKFHVHYYFSNIDTPKLSNFQQNYVKDTTKIKRESQSISGGNLDECHSTWFIFIVYSNRGRYRVTCKVTIITSMNLKKPVKQRFNGGHQTCIKKQNIFTLPCD